MNIDAIGIPLTFIILASIGLWMILYAKGAWYFKFLYISLCLYFSFLMWFSLSDLSGWATESKFPNKTIIHWILVQEPSKFNARDAGNIFIWATEIDEENNLKKSETNSLLKPFTSKKNISEPRVFRLPYSEELHKEAAMAMQQIMSGKTLIGDANGSGQSDSEGQGIDGQNGSQKNRNGNGSLSQQQVFKFYELPPVKLPSKITGREE